MERMFQTRTPNCPLVRGKDLRKWGNDKRVTHVLCIFTHAGKPFGRSKRKTVALLPRKPSNTNGLQA